MQSVTKSRQLTSADYEALERSYISREIADRAGLFRASSIEGSQLIGRKHGDCSGIVFPYYWPGQEGVVLHRLRLDHPPVEAGSGKVEHKYLTAFQSRNRLYLPPCDPKLLDDVTVPLVIVEGEKKCLGLWSMAVETANGSGRPAFLPIAIPGVWGFRSVVGAKTTASGARAPVKGVLPCFDRIFWLKRKTTILFDSNAATNSDVGAARKGLARELSRREGEVYLADLPAVPGINGPDDYLYTFGVAKLQEVLNASHRYEWRSELLRGEKGVVLRLLANAITALRSSPEWCGLLTFNEFSLCVTTTRETPWGQVDKWDEQSDRLLADWLQHHGIAVSDLDASKAVETVARDRSYHPVRDYLDGLKWDETKRLDDLLETYLGAQPSDLNRAAGSKFMLSAVARIYKPGCQADHVPIWESPQGEGKSSAVRVLGEPWTTDDIADLGTKDAALSTIGVWLIELSELDSMSKSDVSRIKAFVSRRVDRFRPPYGRRLIDSPRQCVFMGTTNSDQYLKDESGGRRFWPVECGKIDIAKLRRDRDQLWAEAVARYRQGESWWLDTKELNDAAAREQDARYMTDAWEPVIAKWLEKRLNDLTVVAEVTTADVLREALLKPAGQWTRADETRVGVTLRRLGWRTSGASRPRTYRPPQPPLQVES